ncbi:MAG TPA: hypothetical protein VNK96_02335 [Fimbriimonadales bacterium]|nr:hypothetical protein [Fimbriimonadales bacterium]
MKVTWFDTRKEVPKWHSAEFHEEKHLLRYLPGEPRAPYLIPALVDMHVHGINGIDVMDGDIEQMAMELKKTGIEWFCPTTISASFEKLRSLLEKTATNRNGVIGFHLEGPYLNDKYAGAQPAQFFRKPNISEINEYFSEHLHKISVMTLAPELEGALQTIEFLSNEKIIVNAGHTDANYEIMQKAFEKGLSGITHFYNAMRPFHHREPGCVGFGWMNNINCEIIYDRIHVSKNAMDILLKLKSIENIVAVSDGTKLSGTPDGTETEMWGRTVRKQNGASRSEDGTLCGSAVTLFDVFQNLWRDYACDKTISVLACSYNPRRILRLPPPKLWLLLDENANMLDTFEGELSFALE